MTDRPILIAGRNGQVAKCLRELAAMRGLPAVSLGRPELDLESRDGIDKLIASIAPSAIINAAAYTAVDRAESEQAKAFSVNRDGAAALADVAWQMNIPLIHLSTDYVFDGTKPDATGQSLVQGLSTKSDEMRHGDQRWHIHMLTMCTDRARMCR